MNKELILVFVYSIILIVLLFLSMFFSSSDMVYGSVNLAKLEKISMIKPYLQFYYAMILLMLVLILYRL